MKRKMWWRLITIVVVSCSRVNGVPHLFVPNALQELGVIKKDSTCVLSYSLVNNGNAPLIIDTASASCDCTVPEIKKKIIEPGDSAMLLVKFTPADTGYFNKKLVIKSNADSVFVVVAFRGSAVK